MFIYRKQYYNSLAYSFKSLFCGVFFLGGGEGVKLLYTFQCMSVKSVLIHVLPTVLVAKICSDTLLFFCQTQWFLQIRIKWFINYYSKPYIYQFAGWYFRICAEFSISLQVKQFMNFYTFKKITFNSSSFMFHFVRVHCRF